MDAIWARLKAITEDLDQWDRASQLSPMDFKALCATFLTDLVKDSDGPGQSDVPDASAQIGPQPVAQDSVRRAELSAMGISALRKLAAKTSIRGHNLLRRKADLVEAILGQDDSPQPKAPDQETARRAELQAMQVPALRKLALERGVSNARRLRKAELVEAIEGTGELSPQPVAEPIANEPEERPTPIPDRPRLGFAPSIITPYLHAMVAHFGEQRERLDLIGNFIGVPITHKHISCSPGELSNNKYNRMYFQQSSRRLVGLEREIICMAWRAIINTADIERWKHACPVCTFTCVRGLWMTRHIEKEHPNYRPGVPVNEQ